jgi:hypothetical protein
MTRQPRAIWAAARLLFCVILFPLLGHCLLGSRALRVWVCPRFALLAAHEGTALR